MFDWGLLVCVGHSGCCRVGMVSVEEVEGSFACLVSVAVAVSVYQLRLRFWF